MTVFTSLLLAATVSVAGFCERAERREPLTVAFFGGSLTWGANATDPNITSWRGRICERLRKTYPNTPFRFVDAAIGGTGSELGVFRLDRDVIAHRPDLQPGEELRIESICVAGKDAAEVIFVK